VLRITALNIFKPVVLNFFTEGSQIHAKDFVREPQ